MPIPTSIISLTTSSADGGGNSPLGSDAIGSPGEIDNYIRAVQAVVRQESQNKSWERWNDTPTRTSNTTFTVAGDLTARYKVGRRVKCTDSSTLYGVITASAYTSLTTVTVVLDSGTLSASLSEVMLGPETYAFQHTKALGTSTQVLHGSATGEFTWGSVVLTTDVSGQLPLANIANVTAGKLLGRNSSGNGVPQEISMGTNLNIDGTGTLNYTGVSVGNTIFMYRYLGGF